MTIYDQGAEQKVCEACGDNFGCGAKLEGCWCTGIDLSREAAERLRALFKDCLCKNCLELRSRTFSKS